MLAWPHSFQLSICFWVLSETGCWARWVCAPTQCSHSSSICSPFSGTPQRWSIKQLRNKTQRYTTTCKHTNRMGEANAPNRWTKFTFFLSKKKNKKYSSTVHSRWEVYFSRKWTSTYKRLRNCLVKPLPHYLTFSGKMVVNYFITGKEVFRLVYQNRSRIYPGQGTACKPKQ